MFKDNVLQGESGIKLVEILLVGAECGLLVVDLDTYLLIALDELPEHKALLEVLVLHNGVGAHYGGTDVVSAKSLYDSGALVCGNDVVKLAHTVGKRELAGTCVIGIRRICDLDAKVDLAVSCTALKLCGEVEGCGVLKVLCGKHMSVTLGNKDKQTHEKGVDKAVLIGVYGFLVKYVEYLGGGDVTILVDIVDVIGMLTEMLDRTAGDVTGKLYGKNLLVLLYDPGGVSDNLVEMRQTSLDSLDPLG